MKEKLNFFFVETPFGFLCGVVLVAFLLVRNVEVAASCYHEVGQMAVNNPEMNQNVLNAFKDDRLYLSEYWYLHYLEDSYDATSERKRLTDKLAGYRTDIKCKMKKDSEFNLEKEPFLEAGYSPGDKEYKPEEEN